MRAPAWLALLLAACRVYSPEILDCQVRCGVFGECPRDTVCSPERFCRPPDAVGVCECVPFESQRCVPSFPVRGGPCTPGVRTCSAERRWSPCVGAVEPTFETCNGIDDDCDGVVDGNVIDAPACPLTLGVCGGRAHYASCVGGRFVTCEALEYGRDYEVEESRCDGLDNDCDGVVDTPAARLVLDDLVGDWFLVANADGLELLTGSATGPKVSRFSLTLEPLGTEPLDEDLPLALASDATSRTLAWKTDGGVRFRNTRADGQTREETHESWSDATRLELGVDVAAATVEGRVEVLRLWDGGQPLVLGDSDGGAVRVSSAGGYVAWPGGVWRVANGSPLEAAPPSLLAVLELSSGAVAGIPDDATGSYFEDLRQGTARSPLASPLRALAGVTDGRRVGVVAEGAGGTWLTSPSDTSPITTVTGPDVVRAASVQGDFGFVVALSKGRRLWLAKPCLP